MIPWRALRWAAVAAVVAAGWLAAPAPAEAQASASLPSLTAPVNDLAGVIDRASADEMDRRIRALQAATGDAVIVAAVPTFAPYGAIEEYAVRLFERAGIGAKGKDNGVLILVAVNDRRARIEVGYGLEGAIPDGVASDIIRTAMLPAFRRQAYGEGLSAATVRVIERIARERGVAVPEPEGLTRAPRRERRGSDLGRLIVMIVILLIVLGGGGGGLLSFLLGQAIGGAVSGRRSRRGGWSGWHGGFGGGGFGGGGFGGGFGGFGGGRSGGGGASGGW